MAVEQFRQTSALRRRPYYLLGLPLLGAAIVYASGYNRYTLLSYIMLAFVFAVLMLVVARGWLRDTALVGASVLLCLVGAESYQVLTDARLVAEQSAGFAGSKPVLGWGPLSAGTFPARKFDAQGGVIYDTSYTIDANLLRKTMSAESGPTIAFFGDSFLFGEGLPDRETLPQAFADLEERRLRVLNFAFPGYGPQQFLRALETRLDDALLRGTRLFVFETASWHAERTSCAAPFVLRAPRYVLKDGEAVFSGACAEGVTRLVREVLGNSAAFRNLVQPVQGAPSRSDIDLYIAILARAVRLAREQYQAPTLLLYLPFTADYLKQSGYSDSEIMQKLRAAGAEVIDGTINPAEHPGVTLFIPNEGHPTGAANRIWAGMIKAWLDTHRETLPEAIAR